MKARYLPYLFTILSLTLSAILISEPDFCSSRCGGFPFPFFCSFCPCGKGLFPFDLIALSVDTLFHLGFWQLSFYLKNVLYQKT